MRRPRLQRRFALSAALLVLALCSATPASADVGEAIILRCTHAQSLRGFSQSAYSKALKELSADSEEYSNCASVIRQAQIAAALRARGGSSASALEQTSAIAATPAEQRSIARARAVAPAGIRLGDELVQPGVVHANVASALSSLPGPLIAVLAFLLAGAALLAGGLVRNRLRGNRPD